MPELKERLREVVAAVGDDYFQADTLLYYLNRSQSNVVSTLIKFEKQLKKDLRALDKLRKPLDIDVSGLTFTEETAISSFVAEVPYPLVADGIINYFNYLEYRNQTPLRELTSEDLINLRWGNMVPSEFEGYFNVLLNSTDDVTFNIYLHEDPSLEAGPINVRVYYIKEPTEILTTAETFDELPSQLENCVIYGAAVMMVLQESIKDPDPQVQLFEQIYQKELQSVVY